MLATVHDSGGKKPRLDRISTRPPKGMSRKTAETRFRGLGEELFELQDLLYGAKSHSVLIVLQGRDTAGKDGTVKHVVGCLNPRGVSVNSFVAPTAEELEHDFLWRIHRHTPRRGEFSIFNRSHYEDVLVVRVHDLVPPKRWKKRYNVINDFEEQLSLAGTIVLKFFLHISADEQEKRLLDREREPRKAWKLNLTDWTEREHWDEYTVAYRDAISLCAHKHAPWFIVPADKKWFRNLVVAEAVCAALRPYRRVWERKLEQEGALRRKEIEAYRSGNRR